MVECRHYHKTQIGSHVSRSLGGYDRKRSTAQAPYCGHSQLSPLTEEEARTRTGLGTGLECRGRFRHCPIRDEIDMEDARLPAT